MNKFLLLSLSALCLTSIHTEAQAPFTTLDSIDINNITASVLVHGDMWWNPITEVAFCEFPAHSGKSANFAGSMWMSGYDGSGALHVSAQTYRQDGNDYWPGPLDASDTLTYATSQNWANIWKVNRTDIQYFQTLATHTTGNTPAAILTWPAKGNTFAQGNGGVSLSITSDMAPFVDLNGNGIYEPLLGEYPDVPGDQALWWVFSDNGPAHNQSNGKPLGVETHAMAYAYNRGTLIDDVIYYDYTIVNKSPNNYQNMRMAQWDNAWVGFDLTCYIGFDSTWRMGIGYKSTNNDGPGGGHPVNSYGPDPPQMGITMIVQPGDAGANYIPVGSFDYYNNDASIIGNPSVDTEYSNYMRGKLRNGQHFTDNFVRHDSLAYGYGSGSICNYVYPGDPSDTTEWSECNCNNVSGDRLFILSSNDFTLNAGNSAHLVFALLVADSAKGCPVTSFDSIRVVADTAWDIYHNPLAPLTYNAVHSVQNDPFTVQVYPNPATDMLNIEIAGTASSKQVMITNVLWQTVFQMQMTGSNMQVDVSEFPAGMYFVKVNDNSSLVGSTVTKKFVKE